MESFNPSEYSSEVAQAVEVADIEAARRLLLEHPTPWLALDARLRLNLCHLLVQHTDAVPLGVDESVELINRIGWSMDGVFGELCEADGRLTDEAFVKSGVVLAWLDERLPEEF